MMLNYDRADKHDDGLSCVIFRYITNELGTGGGKEWRRSEKGATNKI